MYEQKLKVEAKNYKAQLGNEMEQDRARFEKNTTNMKIEAEKKSLQNELDIKQTQERQKYDAAVYETQILAKKHELEMADMKIQQDYAHFEKKLKIQSAGYSDNVLKAMVLETTERIYSKLSIKNLSVANIGGSPDSKDTAGQLIAQMAASYKAITEQMAD